MAAIGFDEQFNELFERKMKKIEEVNKDDSYPFKRLSIGGASKSVVEISQDLGLGRERLLSDETHYFGDHQKMRIEEEKSQFRDTNPFDSVKGLLEDTGEKELKKKNTSMAQMYFSFDNLSMACHQRFPS